MKAIFILEGKLNENDQYQLSKDVEQVAKDWGLSSYLDDVLEDAKKRRTEYFTYVHFDKSDGIIEDVKDYVDEESDCIHNLLPDCEIYSDIIEWHFSDENGNKVEMEDAFTEENVGVDDLEEGQYRVYFSRTIESDCQGDAEIEAWMLTDDYSVESNVCEHNNTITNECSDCNEQELKDKYYNQALRNSLNEISNICCDVLADIVYDECKGFGGLDEQIEEDVKDEILKRLSYKENK